MHKTYSFYYHSHAYYSYLLLTNIDASDHFIEIYMVIDWPLNMNFRINIDIKIVMIMQFFLHPKSSYHDGRLYYTPFY